MKHITKITIVIICKMIAKIVPIRLKLGSIIEVNGIRSLCASRTLSFDSGSMNSSWIGVTLSKENPLI